jgi:hypothetical protein
MGLKVLFRFPVADRPLPVIFDAPLCVKNLEREAGHKTCLFYVGYGIREKKLLP